MKSLPLLYTHKVFRIALVLLMLILFFRVFVFEFGRVDGRSMQPLLEDQQVFVVDKLTLMARLPKRGDVIQFFDPNSDTVLVKRVVGLPGERVKLSRNSVSIIQEDGTEFMVEEDYLGENEITDSLDGDTIVYLPIPAYNYYVLGDNRNESTDSRHFGTIGRPLIIGKVISW